MGEAVVSGLVVIAILLGSAVITQGFARWMYNRCRKCGSLNARRRRQCRVCNHPLP